MEKSYIAYYRVSTQKQGQSGLGLSAQKAAVKNFVQGTGTIIASYEEIESGKKDKRPALEQAIAHAKSTGSTLIIAKLDRLSRNVGFIFKLRDEKVDFIAADLPDANTLTIGIMALFAQNEREMISKRTKDALAAKKAEGFKLGSPAGMKEETRLKGLEVRKNNALEDKANIQAMEMAQLYKLQGKTLQEIADLLNKQGYVTRTGKAFVAMTIKRLLERHQEQEKKALEKKRFDKYFEAKMQSESGYTPAYYKEQPNLSPDKIQLELEDGVAYISKKSGWVLSQF